MKNLDKALLGGLGLLLVVLAALTLSLRGDLKALTEGLKTNLTRTFAGVTNYDELALNNAKSYQPVKLSISSNTVINVTATNTERFTKWIDPGSLVLVTSGTSTASSYRVQGTATSSAGILSNFSLITNPSLLDITLQTSSPQQQRKASSTPTILIPWPAGHTVMFTIRGTFVNSDTPDAAGCAGGCQRATSSLRNLGTLDFLFDTYSTSTQR